MRPVKDNKPVPGAYFAHMHSYVLFGATMLGVSLELKIA